MRKKVRGPRGNRTVRSGPWRDRDFGGDRDYAALSLQAREMRPDVRGGAVLDYCAVVRGILNDGPAVARCTRPDCEWPKHSVRCTHRLIAACP